MQTPTHSDLRLQNLPGLGGLTARHQELAKTGTGQCTLTSCCEVSAPPLGVSPGHMEAFQPTAGRGLGGQMLSFRHCPRARGQFLRGRPADALELAIPGYRAAGSTGSK